MGGNKEFWTTALYWNAKRDTVSYCWVLTDLLSLSEQTISSFEEGQLKNRTKLNRLVLEKKHHCPCRITFCRVSESLFCSVANLALSECSGRDWCCIKDKQSVIFFIWKPKRKSRVINLNRGIYVLWLLNMRIFFNIISF